MNKVLLVLLVIVLVVGSVIGVPGFASAVVSESEVVSYPSLSMTVTITHGGGVNGYGLPADTDVSLVITRDSETVFKSEGESDEHGELFIYTYIEYDGELFEIQHGDVVTLTAINNFDEEVSITYTVQYIEVYGAYVDEGKFFVYGFTEEDKDVEIILGRYDWEEQQWKEGTTVTTHSDEEGYWTAEFSQIPNFEIWYGVHAVISDGDGNKTRYSGPPLPPNPVFIVCSVYNNISGSWYWPPNTDITITINDSEEFNTTSNERGGFDISGIDFDIQVGDVITVTGGTITKSHQVKYLEITEINTEYNTISGKADPYSEVWVEIYENWETIVGLSVDADSEGDWIADFSFSEDDPWGDWYNIKPGVSGAVHLHDEEGNATYRGWTAPDSPSINVMPQDNYIFGAYWLPDTEGTITIGNPSDPDYIVDISTDEYGSYGIKIDFNIEAWQLITVTVGEITDFYRVSSLTIAEVNLETQIVSGTVSPGSGIEVGLFLGHGPWGPEWDFAPTVIADDNGNWSANFAAAGITIEPGSEIHAMHWSRNNLTLVYWHVPSFLRITSEYNDDTGKHEGQLSYSSVTIYFSSDEQIDAEINLSQKGTSENPAPEGANPAGIYLDINVVDGELGDVDIILEISYTLEDIPDGMNESNLKLFRYNGETEEWDELPEQEVDTNNRVIRAWLTGFSEFGVFEYAEYSDAPSVANAILNESGISIRYDTGETDNRGRAIYSNYISEVAHVMSDGAVFPAYDSDGEWDETTYINNSDVDRYYEAVYHFLWKLMVDAGVGDPLPPLL